ncbi:FMN-binding protein [Chloroflexota bacterium]
MYRLRKSCGLIAAFFIAVAFLSSLVACVNTPLEFQQDQQTLEMLIRIFPEAGYYIYDEGAEIYNVYDMSKNQTGYAFYAEGKSYEGEEDVEGWKVPTPIKILIGLKDKETIKDILIISHAEGVIFWDLLIKEDYFQQFVGLKITDAYLKDDGGVIDSVTRATLSSTSVLDIVREAALVKVIPGGSPRGSKMEWQIILAPAIVIPFVLIPVVFIWYTTIKQAKAKRATHKEVSQ